MKYTTLIPAAFVCLFACQVKQLSAPSFINDPVDTTKIRFNGFYTMVGKAKHLSADKGAVFTKEKKVFVQGGSLEGNQALLCETYKSIDPTYLGQFTIKNNEIHACVPFYFRKRGRLASPYRIYMTNFRGIIKNRDTITDWKVVPPYPAGLDKEDLDYYANKNWLAPKILYFVKTDAVKCLR
jgi:hypothetical protein